MVLWEPSAVMVGEVVEALVEVLRTYSVIDSRTKYCSSLVALL